MTWANPSLFALLLVVPVAVVFALLGWRARGKVLALFAQGEVLAALLSKRVRRSRGWQAVLGVVAVLALAVAAAGPRLGFDWQQQKVEGVSIVVVLDVSRSMDAQDLSPSRLMRARREIEDLVGLLRGDSVGLVIFAAGAYTRIPLTVDYDTFLWAVGDSETGTLRAQGTELAGALDAAGRMLDRASGSGKAVLVVSDGESHDEGAALDEAVARMQAASVRVYALGIGKPEGAPIPMADGGFKKDAAGNVVLSKLGEDTLKSLAAATGGAYVRSVPSDDDVRALYVTEIRGKLEATERGVRREKVWRESFQLPLAVGLGALVLSSALGIGARRPGPGRTKGRAGRASVAVLLLGCLPLLAWAGAAEDGLGAMAAKDWKKAAELLGQARVEDPGDIHVGQSLAEALYRDGRYRESELLYESLAEQDPAHRPTWLYDAGNAAYKGGQLPDAMRHYQDALAAEKELPSAQKNAEAVQKEIEARLQEKPPEQQPQDGEKGEPQDGEQGEPQPQPQEGEPGEQGGEPQAGGEPQEPPGDPADEPTAAEGELGAEGEGTPQEGEAAAVEGMETAGQMTPEAAARMVDAVEDGKPRIAVGGRGSGKDW